MNDFLTNCWSVAVGLCNMFWFKTFAAVAVGTVMYLIGESHAHLVTALTILVIFDAITGTYAAFINGDTIRSSTALRTPIKWTLYILMISAGHLAEILLPGEWFLSEITIAFLGVTEFISILENVGKAGYAIPLVLLNRLQEFRDKQ